MDKFDEYLKNKSKSENEEFVLPKSFENKLEDTLKNINKENKINVWYRNKKIWATAACFIFLVGASLKYGVYSNKLSSIDKSLESQVRGYSADSPNIARYDNSETRGIRNGASTKQGVSEFSLEDKIDGEFIDATRITKIIFKNIAEGNTYKSIDNKVDIENIIGFINDITKEEIQNQTLEEWDFLIETNGVESNHTIIIKNNIMNIDNKWYKINSEEIDNFKYMYDDLNYDENSIPYCDY